MSKKIAEGTSALVLDVKVGTGAFMAEEADARRLAETMVSIGTEYSVQTSALLTRMDEPLGNKVGNALEVEESLETLRGNGPADLVEVSLALAAEMLALVGIDADPASVLQSGQALLRFKEMIEAQAGDPDAALPRAEHVELVRSDSTGYLRRLDARAVGVAAWRLGAGRARKQDQVSATAGIVCLAKPGDPVESGQVLLELHTDDAERLPAPKTLSPAPSRSARIRRSPGLGSSRSSARDATCVAPATRDHLPVTPPASLPPPEIIRP